MRRLTMVLAPLAVCLLISAADPQNDKERLQGHWVMFALEIEGEKVTDAQVASGMLLVEGDHYTPMYEGKTYPESFTIDPTQSPKAIDFTYIDGPRKGETVKGIYKLEDDRYVMCRTLLHEDERPKEFASKPKSGLVLVVWRREKGAEKAVSMIPAHPRTERTATMENDRPTARRSVQVVNSKGVHMRPSGKFVKLANTFQAEIWVSCRGNRVHGKSILDMTTLAAECGTTLDLEAQGPDAEEALAALVELVASGFHMDDENT